MKDIFGELRGNTFRNGYMNGPFGSKPIVYADSTASGVVYKPILEYFQENIYPFYSNTHSNAVSGKYMAELIDATKKIIRKHYNCDSEDDQIIFTGNGCTGAILHLIHAMNLKENNTVNQKDLYPLSETAVQPDEQSTSETKKNQYLNAFVNQQIINKQYAPQSFAQRFAEERKVYDVTESFESFDSTYVLPKKSFIGNKTFVVFISILEHHSNYLPWKHLSYPVELVPIKANGQLDEKYMTKKMGEYYSRGTKIIASFSGASNVSGIIEDWSKISKIVHSFEGVMLWDMAACGPYVEINMHNNDAEGDYMDAIFLSPHKFLGGPGCPGLLIAHKKLFVNKVPYCPGGGTVRFVCKNYQVYNPDIEVKETGGTPNILGCIQLGKVYELKNRIQPYINLKEEIIFEYCLLRLKEIKNLILVRPQGGAGPEEKKSLQGFIGDSNVRSLPIFSFIIPNYHCNLVVVLLNDLFGIQSRGGISCCSVFAQNILHLNEKQQQVIYQSIEQGNGVPTNYGWCRVSFHYLMSKEEINYILESIELVAQYISKLSEYYEYDPVKNNWLYKNTSWKDKPPSSKLFVTQRNYNSSDLEANLKSIKSFLFRL